MHRNFLEALFGPEDTFQAKKAPGRRPVVTTRHQGAPRSPGAPRGLCPPMETSCTASSPYKFPNIPETLGESRDQSFHHRKFQNHEIQSRALLRHLARGETITEGFIILIVGAPPMMHEQFTIDLLIRFQRIYNFCLFHIVILSILDVIYSFCSNFI